MHIRKLVPGLAGLMLLFAGQTQAAVVEFGALLSGAQETPPVATPGNGSGFFLFDDATKEFSWNISFRDLLSPIGVSSPTAHVHEAPAGSPGDVKFAIDGTNPGTVIDGTGKTEGIFLGAHIFDAALETALFAGDLYVNLHTASAPGGEIRGQILPGSVTVVPLPAGVWLLASAAGLLLLRRRRNT